MPNKFVSKMKEAGHKFKVAVASIFKKNINFRAHINTIPEVPIYDQPSIPPLLQSPIYGTEGWVFLEGRWSQVHFNTKFYGSRSEVNAMLAYKPDTARLSAPTFHTVHQVPYEPVTYQMYQCPHLCIRSHAEIADIKRRETEGRRIRKPLPVPKKDIDVKEAAEIVAKAVKDVVVKEDAASLEVVSIKGDNDSAVEMVCGAKEGDEEKKLSGITPLIAFFEELERASKVGPVLNRLAKIVDSDAGSTVCGDEEVVMREEKVVEEVVVTEKKIVDEVVEDVKKVDGKVRGLISVFENLAVRP
ncbi:hypothetical protein BC829DRAFT_415787 [Chytridium lagenaria]|nr:hypothetical protein BC829DRAFT_415787 [Chytridium lagenaria]